MGQISLSLPQVNGPDTIEEPKIPSNFTILQNAINGNLDGANVVASITGRRLIAQAPVFVGPAVIAGIYLVAVDGTLVASGAAINKALLWWNLDPANHAVTGKSNTTLAIRLSAATNNVSTGSVGLSGNLNAVTFSGSGGNIAPTIGAQQGGAGIGTLSTSSAVVADSTFAFPAAGAYAPIVQLSNATMPANSAMSLLWQLYVLNT